MENELRWKINFKRKSIITDYFKTLILSIKQMAQMVMSLYGIGWWGKSNEIRDLLDLLD